MIFLVLVIVFFCGCVWQSKHRESQKELRRKQKKLKKIKIKIKNTNKGAVFIDRDPTHFRHILNFLRDGIEYLKKGGLILMDSSAVNDILQEARYYNIRPLVDYISVS